ncbi:MAG: chloride channel protein [Desulfobacteraceae bacterium]|nr:chloride channel protein [Desulfobacteraceae bacterium]MCF8095612.1 chloride channel protein [Desulfobacteraceae bacterium]
MDDRLLLIAFGAVVGVCSGLAAVALYYGLVFMVEHLSVLREHWWVFVLPGIGMAVSSLFLEKVVREGAGHGVPEVVYSVSRHGGLLRLRSSFSRLISNCLTIGSGGSAGPEAPVIISGASIGSNIAKLFSLNERQRITLVGCGSAGALSAIFNAPVAGMVFTIEIIMGEWSAANVVPIAVASVAGAQITRLLRAPEVSFTHLSFNVDLTSTLASVGLAVVTAAVSIIFARALRYSHHFSDKIPLPVWIRAFIGGCLVGAIGLMLPGVLGEGYHSIGKMVEGAFAGGLGLMVLLVAAKILATALTLGWGGSGGIFAPCLVIGSFAGLMYHRFIDLLWPGLSWVNEGCYALLGMAGLISGTMHAPLTGIFLIVDITGRYDTILPLILVSALSTTICHVFEPASFYLRDLIEKGQYLKPRTDAKVLADMSISELVEKDCRTVPRNMLLGDFVKVVQQSHRDYFPVVDENTGEFQGMIHLNDIRPYLFDSVMYETVFLEQIMKINVETVDIHDELSDVLDRMDANGLFSMPVVSSNRFVGMISKATLLDRYRNELIVQTQH